MNDIGIQGKKWRETVKNKYQTYYVAWYLFFLLLLLFTGIKIGFLRGLKILTFSANFGSVQLQ